MAYSTTSDMEEVFGVDNIADWADPDAAANATNIAARKTGAISISDAEIEDVARMAQYKVPMQAEAGGIPTTVKYLSAVGAGVWLLESGRGCTSFDERSGKVYHKWMLLKEWRQNYLERIRTQQVKLDAIPGY